MGGKRIADQVRRALIAGKTGTVLLVALSCGESSATNVRDGGSPVTPRSDAQSPFSNDGPHECRQLCFPSQGCRFNEDCRGCACPSSYACNFSFGSGYCIPEGASIWNRDAAKEGGD
jgi:hypothetical protein